jgi:hypothetical protein
VIVEILERVEAPTVNSHASQPDGGNDEFLPPTRRRRKDVDDGP